MAEMLDFGGVKEEEGTSRSKSSSLHASLFWLPCGGAFTSRICGGRWEVRREFSVFVR